MAFGPSGSNLVKDNPAFHHNRSWNHALPAGVEELWGTEKKQLDEWRFSAAVEGEIIRKSEIMSEVAFRFEAASTQL